MKILKEENNIRSFDDLRNGQEFKFVEDYKFHNMRDFAEHYCKIFTPDVLTEAFNSSDLEWREESDGWNVYITKGTSLTAKGHYGFCLTHNKRFSLYTLTYKVFDYLRLVQR